MPVEMVLREVEHRGGGRLEALHAVQLEAREFEHPDVGQRLGIDVRGQGVEQRRPDVAGHGHALARALDQLAGERGDGGLAVGAGDGEHRGRVALGRRRLLDRHQLELRRVFFLDRGGGRVGGGEFGDLRDELGGLPGGRGDVGLAGGRQARHGGGGRCGCRRGGFLRLGCRRLFLRRLLLFFGRRRGGNAQRRVARHGFGLRGGRCGFGFCRIGSGLCRFRHLGRCRLLRCRGRHSFRRFASEWQFALRLEFCDGLRRHLHHRLVFRHFSCRFDRGQLDGPQVQQRACKQIQFAADREPHGPRRIDDRCNGRGGQPRRAVHGTDRCAFDQRGRERPADERDLGPFRPKRRKQRRRLPRIGHRDGRAVARAPARHRQPGRTEAEDQYGEVFQVPHVISLLFTAASASTGPRGTAAS